MTIRVQITHTDLGSDRTLEIRLESTAANAYLEPGESTIVHVYDGTGVLVLEGMTVQELRNGKAKRKAEEGAA